MTPETFRKEIKKTYRVDDITNYVIAIFVIAIGVYFMVKSVYFKPYGEPQNKIFLKVLAFFTPIAIGSYVFWRIPKDYIVLKVETRLPVADKIKIIESYFETDQIIANHADGKYRFYCYQNQFWRKVDVRFYVDDAQILYNVQAAEIGLKGVLDFGLTKRATKRLSDYLNTACL